MKKVETKNPEKLNRMHKLKTWPEYYEKAGCYLKPFELRKNDRAFAPNDILLLQEWCPEAKVYTGREKKVRVVSILRGPIFGIKKGFVLMAVTTHDPDRTF